MPRAKAKANLHLLALPHVVQNQILSYLPITEQLKLRLVCKTVKEWIDDRAKRLSHHIPTTTIKDFGRRTFSKSCKGRLPHAITNLYLENESIEVYNDVGLSTFLRYHSTTVETLRIKKFFLCPGDEKQLSFIGGFPNLEEFEIDELWICNCDGVEIEGRVPPSFQNLKVLKFGVVKVYQEGTYELVTNYTHEISNERRTHLRIQPWKMIDACHELIHLRVPASPKNLFENTFDECFKLLSYIRSRSRGGIPTSPGHYLMTCDINNIICCSASLEVLLIIGFRMRIEFLNVNSKVFKRGAQFCFMGPPSRTRFDCIRSLVSSALVNRSFEHLQKLTFQASLIQNECIIGREKGPALFPKLKEFVIIIDIGADIIVPSAVYSRIVVPPSTKRNVCFPRADQVLKFFFPENGEYRKVRVASIIFTDPVFPNQRKVTPERLESLNAMIKCLPKLRNLTIKGWYAKRETYLKLWQGFPALKRLCIDRCPTFNATCLIGGNGNPTNPANFQHLPALEYLELKALDEMPGLAKKALYKPSITDVFQRMGFVPFKFLSGSQINDAIWIRPIVSPQPSLNSNAPMITRSVARAMKMKISSRVDDCKDHNAGGKRPRRCK